MAAADQDLLKKLTTLIDCCNATREAMLSNCPWEANLMQTEELAKEAKEQLVALEKTAGFPENLTPETRAQLKDLLGLWNAALENMHNTAKDLFDKAETSINEEF